VVFHDDNERLQLSLLRAIVVGGPLLQLRENNVVVVVFVRLIYIRIYIYNNNILIFLNKI
jgi:hypothetical protein